MNKYLFVQSLAFSPLRYVLQDTVLDRNFLSADVSNMKSIIFEKHPELHSQIHKILDTVPAEEDRRAIETSSDLNPSGELNYPDIQRVIWGDEFYPLGFYQMADPPWALSVVGNLRLLHSPKMLTVVGSREPWSGSLDWMDLHLPELVMNDWVLVSGGARGVDFRAHQICMRKLKPTIVFLPSGLSNPYPSLWEKAWQSVTTCGGALVSEFPDHYKMKKYSFGFRNRLMAQISCGVLIVEVKQKSGTLMTAHQALENAKNVFIVPTHPTLPGGTICSDLMRLGAQWVTDAQDLSLVLSDSFFIKTDSVHM